MLNNFYLRLNQTQEEFSSDKTVIDRFEEHAQKSPHQTAVISENGSISYQQLNARSNTIAHLLQNRQIGEEDIIPIWMDRSTEVIVAIFAILKAGAAFLLLDLTSPPSRLKNILEGANVKCLLTRMDFPPIEGLSVPKVYLDDPELSKESPINPKRQTNGHHLAYVCYTSGSTGMPKGVQIEHRSLINRLEWMQKAFPIGTNDRLFQKTTLSFDVSIWELFWWAIAGASVVLLPPRSEHNPKVMLKLIQKHAITAVHFVPSVLHLFLDYLSYQDISSCRSLKWVFSSGEALAPHLVNEFYHLFRSHPSIALINLYGPTEATVDVTCFACSREDIYTEIPIGKPIQNTRLYVLTENEKLAEINEAGELLLAGICLARGYLNDRKGTSEKFKPVACIPEDRLYHTGDLVKIRGDGQVIYLGRIDHQVKIRGLRIELGEIEFHLKEHPAIKDCAVIAIKEHIQEQFLSAFIILKSQMVLSEPDLKSYLSERVPTYMVPARFHFLDAFPLTSSGKLNRTNLRESFK